jgi:UDP-glucose 4-epimerase
MNVLVIGGAGYVGSHALLELKAAGHVPTVFDNLSEGHRAAVGDCPFIEGDLGNASDVAAALERSEAEAVMHFAAFASVPESVEYPERYYYNNVVATLDLLRTMRERGVNKFVFSGSCSVYGIADEVPITEAAPFRPISPYAATKAMVETIMADYAAAYGLQYASLRYFNASGAAPDGSIGEDHRIEGHLIPLVCQTALGQRESISIFGDDYPTSDGTCVRDYVHVMDLATAHVLALEALDEMPQQVYNLGTGTGNSVREVIDVVREVSGCDFKVLETPRRPGDPPTLVGSCDRIKSALDWQPHYADIRQVVETAWRWHSTHPDGFADR